MVMKLIRKTHT